MQSIVWHYPYVSVYTSSKRRGRKILRLFTWLIFFITKICVKSRTKTGHQIVFFTEIKMVLSVSALQYSDKYSEHSQVLIQNSADVPDGDNL